MRFIDDSAVVYFWATLYMFKLRVG